MGVDWLSLYEENRESNVWRLMNVALAAFLWGTHAVTDVEGRFLMGKVFVNEKTELIWAVDHWATQSEQ